MSLATEIKFSSDGRVAFDPVAHTYTLDGVKRLQGITSLISKYTERFDKERVSLNYALKHGLDQQEVLREWDDGNRDSTFNGSLGHDILENYILTRKIIDNGAKKAKHIIQFIYDYFETGRLIPVEAEMIVHNDHYASQIDCIAKNKLGQYFILDWKTNKEIKREGFAGRKMRYPFHKYQDCNYYHYSLQVGIYKIMCKKYDIKDCFIVHFHDDGYDIIRAHPVVIPPNLLTTPGKIKFSLSCLRTGS